MKLTAENVRNVISDCLFRDGEPTEPRVEQEGIMRKFGFHPERLATHKDDVASMLAELPDEFQSGKGGGMSFLSACMTKSGEQWAEHPTMDELFVLGQALGLVKLSLPREMWRILPGGMPYYTVV